MHRTSMVALALVPILGCGDDTGGRAEGAGGSAAPAVAGASSSAAGPTSATGSSGTGSGGLTGTSTTSATGGGGGSPATGGPGGAAGGDATGGSSSTTSSGGGAGGGPTDGSCASPFVVEDLPFVGSADLGDAPNAYVDACDPFAEPLFAEQTWSFVPQVTSRYWIAAPAAISLRTVCDGASLGHDCCEPHGTPGCSDPSVEAEVCGADPYCCEELWDGACVGSSAGCGIVAQEDGWPICGSSSIVELEGGVEYFIRVEATYEAAEAPYELAVVAYDGIEDCGLDGTTSLDDLDGDGLAACEDPDCLPLCINEVYPLGGLCEKFPFPDAACISGGHDGLCLSSPEFSLDMCSEFCDLEADDCGAGALCLDVLNVPSGAGACFSTCDDHEDCTSSPILGCWDPGAGVKLCWPDSCQFPQEAVLGTGATNTAGTAGTVHHGSCMPGTTWPDVTERGAEAIFSFTATATGTLVARGSNASSGVDVAMYVRTACSEPESEIVCVDQEGPDVAETASLEVVSGGTYLIFVDLPPGQAASSFRLELEMR